MPVRLKNNARGLLAVSITALDTVIRVRVGQGERFPTLGDNDWFPLVLEDDQGNIEITRAIARSGDAITVMRGQDGTQSKPFPADALVSLRITQKAINSWFTGEEPTDEGEGDPDYGGTGLIFNGLIVNAYHTEQGRQGYFHPNSGTSEGQYVFAGACYMAAEAIQDYIDDHQPVPEGMKVDGTLPNARPGDAYEGRLQISDSIGVCTVEQIDGDTLPPGSRIRVDNYRKEVVIDWPAYAELPGDPIPNGDFEKGDQDWIKGPGWSIEPTGNGNDGHGARVAVYRGHGESFLESQAFTPCSPGERFPVKVNVQQGASSAGNAGAGICMRYYSAQDASTLVGQQFGNQVWSGARGRWHWSTLDAVVPEGANFQRAAIVGGRKRENKPLWVDDASWSIPTVIGTNDSYRVFSLTLTVADSADQVAEWSGFVVVTKPNWDDSWSTYSINTGSGTASGFALPEYLPTIRKYITRSTTDGVPCVVSDDFSAWESSGSPTSNGVSGTGRMQSFAYSPALSITVLSSRSRTLYSSNSGSTWVNGGENSYAKYMEGMVWIPEIGMFAAIGSSDASGLFFLSSDGINWMQSSHNVSPGNIDFSYSPELNLFVVVGGNGETSFSGDGIEWENGQFTAPGNAIPLVIWCGDRFICGNSRGAQSNEIFYESLDGKSWHALPSGITENERIHGAYVPYLEESVFSIGNSIYRHKPGSGSFVLSGTRPYAATGMRYDPHSRQILRTIGRSSSANLDVSNILT